MLPYGERVWWGGGVSCHERGRRTERGRGSRCSGKSGYLVELRGVGVSCHEGKLVCCHKISVWKGGSCH